MVKTVKVERLNGSIDVDLVFHSDINLLTGKNGSGKTSLLKLLWFVISANLERIPGEISFQEAVVETTDFRVEITRKDPEDPLLLDWRFVPTVKGLKKMEFSAPAEPKEVEAINQEIIKVKNGSLFFPTFRRMEGGFSMGERRILTTQEMQGHRYVDPYSGPSLELAVKHLAARLSVRQHRFIASTSTHDLVEMLTEQYANISERINRKHTELSQKITGLISSVDRRGGNVRSSDEDTLRRIEELVEENAKLQAALLLPFTTLGDLISSIFKHKGIRVTSRVTLGEAKSAIMSESLSAGEKQMLSFLVYNAFSDNSVIIIDEPEISLHVDWQRRLFPTLLAQGKHNQFIAATHSPFIYSKYADKELVLHADKGDQ